MAREGGPDIYSNTLHTLNNAKIIPMNIVVIIRQTPDTEAKIKVSNETTKIDKEGITWIINPYDEFAIEKALKIKEQLGEGEVILLSCGPDKTEEALRQGLAMGADRAVFIKDNNLETADPYVISKILSEALKSISYDLILTGKKVIDLETSQIPIFIAEKNGLTFSSFVIKINEVKKEMKTIIADREVDGSHEIVEINLPALITCDRGDDIPRYASITNIMKAKKKEIKELSLPNLNLENKIITESLELPPQRKEVQILDGNTPEEKAKELIKMLREEAKVI